VQTEHLKKYFLVFNKPGHCFVRTSKEKNSQNYFEFFLCVSRFSHYFLHTCKLCYISVSICLFDSHFFINKFGAAVAKICKIESCSTGVKLKGLCHQFRIILKY
jgi:hypothetical protein